MLSAILRDNAPALMVLAFGTSVFLIGLGAAKRERKQRETRSTRCQTSDGSK